MKRKMREVGEFGLSFLDVISCGFGAVILLLIITKTVEPIVLEDTTSELEAMLADLQEELFDIRGDTRVVQRRLDDRQAELDAILQRLARLQQERSRIRGEYATTVAQADTIEEQQSQLADARQSLTEEMRRLQGQPSAVDTETVGGIPVDSEYIIFVIDTSGSMYNFAWDMVIEKIQETLDVYPRVRGIQIMNDMGDYMFPRYAQQWIPDTPQLRNTIISGLRGWNAFSNSSPVEGITAAINTFWSPDRKISIYVFGDEFSPGQSIERVIDTVDLINRADDQGTRRVRIHAIGFPVQFANPENMQLTGRRFAALMRELTARNGGTFVGLNRFDTR